eukprot:GFUD01046439.1.p1 GENE.GFUD01046439.1~~GFUD01046439.1.p1  ORF type:complete len:154 (-),score=41.89 GFUD01046439.1:121-582(-)
MNTIDTEQEEDGVSTVTKNIQVEEHVLDTHMRPSLILSSTMDREKRNSRKESEVLDDKHEEADASESLGHWKRTYKQILQKLRLNIEESALILSSHSSYSVTPPVVRQEGDDPPTPPPSPYATPHSGLILVNPRSSSAATLPSQTLTHRMEQK